MDKLKGIRKFSKMEANILPTDPPFPTTLGGWGRKVEIQLFQKHGHVAYQMKGYHKFSNMVANILPADPYTSPENEVNRSKFDFFRTWSWFISN